MIPVKLKIEGFLSYRQPVELDFSNFSLACISGENGAGKSALLDAITWALFGVARKRDESVINNHPSVTAAQVALDFDYEGNRYRVQRVNPRGKTSAVEFFIWSTAGEGDEGRWKPLTERTLRETDKKIEDTLRMDFDTFSNASFFLQGKADQFATARPADRKRILSNILGLEIWESYRDAASLRRRDLEKNLRVLDGRLSEIQVELDEEPQRVERLEALQARLGELTKQRQERAAILENVRRMRAALDEQAKMLGTYQSQIDNLTRNQEQILVTLAARREEKAEFDQVIHSAEAIEKAYQEWQAAREALQAMEEVAAQFRQREALRHEPLRLIETEKARLEEIRQGLIEQRTSLESALDAEPTLIERFGAAKEGIAAAQEKLAKRVALQDEVQRLQAEQAEAKAENPRLRDEMLELKSRIDQLTAAEGADCPVCGQPLTSDERSALIEELTQNGSQLGDRFRDNKHLLATFEEKLSKLGAELADLNGEDAALREATRQADQLDHQLENLYKQKQEWEQTGEPRLLELIASLEEKAFAQEARARLDQIDQELAALGYDLEAHEKLRQAENAGRQAEEDLRQLEKARSALAPIEREIIGLEKQQEELEKNLAAMTAAYDEAIVQYAAAEGDLPDLAQAESDLHDIQEQENRLLRDVGAAMQTVTVLETLKVRKAGLLEERSEITQGIADLKQLERAFGKDGIPALLIEQALPEIEETTNTLLSRLSNGRMSFSFVTQREYKDGSRDDLKETLDMVISDNVGERDYEMFSGGEAFRVNFSIRLALSQVLARRAGARLQTLVIDEGFGSQDAQGRQRLVEAINLVKDDFEKILVITHLDELKDAFPTRIEVEKTPQGSQLQVM
jgi:DNA repair protein SbcC/Rad50